MGWRKWKGKLEGGRRKGEGTVGAKEKKNHKRRGRERGKGEGNGWKRER
jgi:hypothetical protein